MKILNRYINKTLLVYNLLVLVVFLAIYGFFDFFNELSSIGQANYTSLSAIKYIVLQMPEIAYTSASTIILIGCLLGMGYLATTSQLLILRSSGLSVYRITLLTVKISLTFVFIFIFVGEIIAPMTSEIAEKSRANDLGKSSLSQLQQGFWIKDGDNYINVKKNLDGNSFAGVTMIQVNSNNQVEVVITSESASFDGDSLELGITDIFSIDRSLEFDTISHKERNSYNKPVSFDEDLIYDLRKKPKDLTTWNIFKQIQFLSDNKLNYDNYKIEFYNRLAKPFTLVAMILLAMFFIFSSNRHTSLGKKLFLGISLSLSFELVSRIGGAISVMFNVDPLINAFLPSLVVMVLAIIVLRKYSTG